MISSNEEDSNRAIDTFLANNPELEELSARLARFNVFSALGIEKAEIKHSNTLGWLLDPRESHGLDEVVLRRFLSSVLLNNTDAKIPPGVSARSVELMDFNDVEVRREWMHIDLLVLNHTPAPDHKLALVVENKIRAGGGPEQLHRYEKAVYSQFKDYKIIPVLLTLEEAQGQEHEDEDLLRYGYGQLLGVLQAIYDQRKSQMPPPAEAFLKQYLDTIGRLTMPDKEMARICKEIYRKHREAVDLIVKYGKASKFQDAAEAALTKVGHELLYSNTRRAVFMPRSWQESVPENCTVWPNHSKRFSVCCWLAASAKHKIIRLVFEVGKMDDPKLRLACVNALRDAGFTVRVSTVYSRFLSCKAEIQDLDDEAEVREAIRELLERAKEPMAKAQAVFRQVFAK